MYIYNFTIYYPSYLNFETFLGFSNHTLAKIVSIIFNCLETQFS